MEQTNSVQNYLQKLNRKNQFVNQADENNKLHSTSQMEGLRLLSINKASKILGIRYETVIKLVKAGRIRTVITINNKYKIPYLSLVEFVKGSNEVKQVTTKLVSIDVTQNRIDNLLKEYAG